MGIKPDSTLKAIFPVASIDMLKMAGYFSKHLSLAMGGAPAIQPKSSDVAPGSRVATSRVRLMSFDIGYTPRLLELSSGYPCMLFGAAARPARRDAATTATVVAVFKILIFRNFKRFEDG